MDKHIRIPNQTLELKDCKIVHQMLYQTPLFEISIDGIDNKKLEVDFIITKYIINDTFFIIPRNPENRN